MILKKEIVYFYPKFFFNLALFTFYFSAFSFSQNTLQSSKTDDNDIQQQLENITENTTNEDADYTDLLEQVNYYKEHPININKTDREELQALQLLNDFQINNLLGHIIKYGKLITIYELQSIDGFDLQTIRKLLPYIRVNDNFGSAHFGIKEMFKNGYSTIAIRYGRVIEQQKGFSIIDSTSLYKSKNSRYIGSPDKVYTRYRFTYATNVSWGITAEKDQGELLFKKNQKFKYDWYNQSLNGNQKTGFDFYSAHLYLHNIKFIKSLAIGDYQVTFGQGLTAWTSYAFGKSSAILNVKKSATGIHPYSSSDENKFMRGVASSIAYKNLELTGFFSRKYIDATITDTMENGEVAAVSSLQETGYHTTPGEIADKHSVLQTIYGGNISYKGKKINVGLTAARYLLNKEYNRTLSFYNQFDFSSRQNFNIGLDYNFIFRNFNFFGEEAKSQNGGMAFLNGALISLDPRLSLTFIHRYYQRNYQNLISNGFAEGTTASNEKGVYIGMVAKPINTITLTAYYDRFEFPWLKYRVNAPSHGNDYVVQLNYTPSKKTDMYFRIRERRKEKNTSDPDALVNYTVPVKETNYRFNISYVILPSIKLRNRIELMNYEIDNNKTQMGYLVYQDIVYSKSGNPLSVTLRYALFQTDSYDARIYAYENDIPGSFSIPSYYMRGSRFYILMDYYLSRRIEIWLRYSQTFYDDRHVISEGTLAEINGNIKSEIGAQVKIKF